MRFSLRRALVVLLLIILSVVILRFLLHENNMWYIISAKYVKAPVLLRQSGYLKGYNKTDARSRIINNHSNHDNSNKTIHAISIPVVHEKIFRILVWAGYDHLLKNYESCEYKNCIGTFDKSLFNESDAVIFTIRVMGGVSIPKYRFPFQKWIMRVGETPQYEALYSTRYNKFDNVFNTTWSYNRKSDIWTNYSYYLNQGGLFKKRDNIIKGVKKNYAAGKTKQAVWFVSHCSTYSLREKYVKNLQKYMKVDIYGTCGKLQCKNMTMCLKMVERDYKYYLSFENSLCDDYFTEKMWNGINIKIIPIVLGAFKYSDFLPHKSYIDVKDYRTPKDLANYLNLLDQNDTLYNEYLEWKENYNLVHHPRKDCIMCEYLNKSQNITKSYEHLDQFWNPKTDCYSPSKFYKNIDASSWK